MIELLVKVNKFTYFRLDNYIHDSIKDYSRTQIQSWIKSGLVCVNNSKEKSSYIVQDNDKIIVKIPKQRHNFENIEPIKMDLDILYEDDLIAIINKPVGLVVHPGNGNFSHTLVNGLVHHFKFLSDINGNIRPGIVHRLDADTSGIMLVAKNNIAHKNLSFQFQNRKVSKEYIAITWGNWEKNIGIINEPIKRNKKDPTKFSVNELGKKSITRFIVKKQFRHLSLIKFFPETGRTHQIRVHSSWKGNPIFGDKKYGGAETKTRGFLPEINKVYGKLLKNFRGHALHAKSIQFNHPKTNKIVSFDSPLSLQFENLVNSIQKYYEQSH